LFKKFPSLVKKTNCSPCAILLFSCKGRIARTHFAQNIGDTFIMKKQAGSPKEKKVLAKHIPISGRFTPEEAKQIYDAIAKTGTSRSDFVRNSLLSSAEAVKFMGR
jgi:hypothetical protein